MRLGPLARCLTSVFACAAAAAAGDDVWPRLVRESCLTCHSGEAPEAQLNLEPVVDAGLAALDLPHLDRLHALLRTGAMPPPEEPRPEAATLSAALDALDAERQRRAAAAAHPGRVTLRRLNRTQYNCTIRDLFGMPDLRPADEFPADDVGYGFDNIGDVLMLPPALVERYLVAAERIAQRAILAPETYQPPSQSIEGSEFVSLDGVTAGTRRGRHTLASSGELAHDVSLALGGPYEIAVTASGDQAGDEPPRMVLRLSASGESAGNEKREIASFDVAAVAEHPETYRTTLQLEPGEYTLWIDFVNDYYRPEPGGQGAEDRNLHLHAAEIRGPLHISQAMTPESHRRLIVSAPSAASDDWDERARAGLRPFVRRAYRRAVDDEEVERLVAVTRLAQPNGESFERGMQLAVTAVLTSPQFLFHVERPAERQAVGDREPLGDYELANRLSYFLWSSMPDDELLALAERGRLRDPQVLDAQAQRLLADPRSATFLDSFAEQWLHLRELWRLTPDPKRFPDFDDELRAAMWGETRALFEHVVRQDLSVLDLIDADYTFLNERLARHYGIEGVSGPELRKVPLADRRRGGLLAQASVLSVTSNPTRTSPVKRGRWVLEQLLGEPPPAPPPGVPPLADDSGKKELTGTLRQRMEQHRADPSCAVCHRRMDAVGFGLENFDAIGAWREADGGAVIDASAELGPGQAFAGPAELKALLRRDPAGFYRTLSQKLLTYALGRGLELHDRLAVEKIASGLAAADGRFARLVSEIVASEPFRFRQTEGDEP